MFDFLSPAFAALLQVILIDIVLAGDNALVIGMVAARVPKASRKRVIFWALVVAVVLRIVLALITATLLQVIGLMFAGGLLLLWVSWRLYREIRHAEAERIDLQAMREAGGPEAASEGLPMRKAIVQVALADISMSLDNVLAVAGAAMDHVWVLTIGLLLSIALMGVAAAMIANLLQRHPWISYAGLLIVLYVAVRMVWVGGWEIVHAQDREAHMVVRASAVAAEAGINGRCPLRWLSGVQAGQLCPA
ncbi:MAG: TerC family protein [Alphaproteobacteria bacterium]|nr:TerC family protein [Alphaproteobacteria bacterium]